MKPLMVVYVIVLFVLVFSPCISIAEEGSLEEYVYASEIEGGKLYRYSQQIEGGKKKTVEEEVRRMETISPGTILEIEKGASVALTCGSCNTIMLDYSNSPYTVNMADFKRDSSVSGIMLQRFWAALKDFVFPGSKPEQSVHMRVRGDVCKNILPFCCANILVTEDPVTFLLGKEGSNFSLRIEEFDSRNNIYSKKATSNRINVPIETFTPDKTYEWFTTNIKTDDRCNANFKLLSKDESIKIIKKLNEITSLLPAEVDAETRYRFQAGYLISDGLGYDAWRLLDRNGVL